MFDSDSRLSRRDALRLAAAGVVSVSSSGWIEALADEAAAHPARRRACILLWMNGGPSQLDTFDPKPGHKNGGAFRPIATAAPGVQIAEHLPKLAQQMKHLVPVRSMSTKEGDHGRATFLMRTGNLPQGAIRYPPLGALVAKELGSASDELPSFVSIAPFRPLSPEAYGPGFLGSQFAPLIVGESAGSVPMTGQAAATTFKVEDLEPPSSMSAARTNERLAILAQLEQRYTARQPTGPALSHRIAYDRATRLMRSQAAKAFDLSDEPTKLREQYGKNPFGQGCLLARRLVERGVPFVEVTLSNIAGNQGLGWDTHIDNFASVRRLCEVLDPAWATLMTDLKAHGLLDTTIVVWMGEFGRTPKINDNGGRDHFPQAWSTVIGGGGIHGGQALGKTSADGMTVVERPVAVTDLLATICLALGIDPSKQNDSNVGRPIRIVDPKARPIHEILT